MIKAANLIDAIKIYREVYPEYGLRDSKLAVELIKGDELFFNPTKKVCPECKGTGLIDA